MKLSNVVFELKKAKGLLAATNDTRVITAIDIAIDNLEVIIEKSKFEKQAATKVIPNGGPSGIKFGLRIT